MKIKSNRINLLTKTFFPFDIAKVGRNVIPTKYFHAVYVIFPIFIDLYQNDAHLNTLVNNRLASSKGYFQFLSACCAVCCTLRNVVDILKGHCLSNAKRLFVERQTIVCRTAPDCLSNVKRYHKSVDQSSFLLIFFAEKGESMRIFY
jgi:hypothetical protein